MAKAKSRRNQAVQVTALVMLVLIAYCVKAYQSAQGAGAAVAVGAATIVDPNTGSPLTTGNSATVFTLALPTGASCTGDSANGGYRVQSFMVPASVDPTTLTFGSTGPLPNAIGANFRQPLYITPAGSPYVNAQTAAAVSAGGPGQIVNIPRFNLSVFPAGAIPAGDYLIGIACTVQPQGTTAPQVDKVWDVKVTVTANASDPVGITWTVSSTTTTTTTTAASTTTTSSTTSTTSTTVAPTTTTVAPTTTTVAPTTTTVAPTTTTVAPTTTTVAPTTTTVAPTTTTVAPTTTTVAPTTTTVAPDTTTTVLPTTTTTLAPTTTTVVPPTTIGLPGPTTTLPVVTTTPRNGLVCAVLQRIVNRLSRFFPFLRAILQILLSVLGCRP